MVDSLKIEVMYHDGAHELESHGNWIDLATDRDYDLKAGEFQILSTGISMKMPYGYEGYLAPRSSTFKKYGIIQTNGWGVVDAEYCGPDDIWGMPVYSTRDIFIPAGTRVAQFRIQKIMPQVELVTVDSLDYENRNGFGSSGEQAAN